MRIYKSNIFTFLGALFIALLAATESGFSNPQVDLSNPAFAPAGNSQTSIPIGHAEFCKTRRNECEKNPNPISAMKLTQDRWQELLNINSRYNSAIVPVTDMDLYGVEEFWTYANGYGDCEEYVLDKRRALTSMGWPASILLISVLRQASGEGHAVLMVRTDRGDLILDNQSALIKVWNETPYLFLKRQSQADSGKWVDIYDQRSSVVAIR